MEEEPTMQDLFTAFGVDQEQEQEQKQEQQTEETSTKDPNQTPEQTEGEPGEPTPEENSQEQDSEQQEQQPEQDQQEQKPSQQEKLNQAFAQMRVENKELKNLMKGIGDVLGVQDTDNPDELKKALNDQLVQAQAKQKNVDPELLQEMQQLRTKQEQYEQDEIRRQAYLGFQNVKQEFGLEDSALQDFADQLVSEGLNPFEQKMDLKTQYIQRNYSKLLQEAEERGAQKEAQKSAGAEKHSTTPSTKTGQQQGEPTKINSVHELNEYFKQNNLTE